MHCWIKINIPLHSTSDWSSDEGVRQRRVSKKGDDEMAAFSPHIFDVNVYLYPLLKGVSREN